MLAEKIPSIFQGASLFHKPEGFRQRVQRSFNEGHPLIMICATGIVVRTLAPVLQDKYHDPPVLVLDEQGRYVIPLLSGHEGGANHLAGLLADGLGAQPVMTTANSYTNPVYTLGVGCERHCPLEDLEAIIQQALDKAGLTLADMASISSLDIKADEKAMLDFSALHRLPFSTFDVSALRSVEHLLSVKSNYVFQTVGVYGVAESAALYAAAKATSQQAELVLPKIKNPKATCAIARSYGLLID